MESSNDSFAWTSTSSGTSDSDFKGSNMSTTIHTKAEDGDSTDNKKKLQKRLFEEAGSGGEEPPRKRKKKLKREREKTPASPRVKCEPESDVDAELELRVKQEQANNSTATADTNDFNHEAVPTSESDMFTNSDRKSKKSKKRKRNSSLNNDVKDMIVEDMFSAEETVVEKRQRESSENLSPKKHRKSISKESIDIHNGIGATFSSKEFISDDSSSSDEKSERKEKKKKKKKKRKRHSESQEVEQRGSETDGTGGHIEETSFQSAKSSHKKSIISDRIQFEDDSQTENEKNTTNGHPATTQSTRLKRFIKSNPHLEAITPCGGSDSLITPDDEVWVLKCPHEVDISSLKGKDLHLDTKCKLKIDGQAYDGSLNEESGSIPVLSCTNNQFYINIVSLMGTVSFRKRIPKPHFVEDNVVINNQTNFIPLPDTKRRHPLFGHDYKKAMKIPSAIKERLKVANEPQEELLEKKKKKRHREEESVEEPVEAMHEPHKKKKKKHHLPSAEEDEDAPPRKKSKKSKNAVSADTWESEKAIEESLFNF